MTALKMCPDQVREIMLDWLIPATEDGEIDHKSKKANSRQSSSVKP